MLKRSHLPDSPADCEGAIERYVWDGDDLVKEFRYPGREGIELDSLEVDSGVVSQLISFGPITPPDTIVRYSPYYGVTSYVYGGVIDRPLLAARFYYGVDSLYFGNEGIVLHYDWRGNVLEGTRYNGTSTHGLKMNWPSEDMQVYRSIRPRTVLSWVGNVIEQSRDASGLMYMRNRYYDPISGQFTQEDPIGLAGGMNLYGFAGGDPVNFSDPFGLSADCLRKGVNCPKSANWFVRNEALMTTADQMYSQSAADGRERGAYLFRNSNGTVRVGDIKAGDPRSGQVELGTAPSDAIGEIHTHPDVRQPSGFVLPGGPPSGNDASRVRGYNHYSVVVGSDKVWVIPWKEPGKAIQYDKPKP